MLVVWDYYDNTGVIDISINNNKKVYKYRYIVDAAYLPGWLLRKRYDPKGVLNEIKKIAIKTIKLN